MGSSQVWDQSRPRKAKVLKSHWSVEHLFKSDPQLTPGSERKARAEWPCLSPTLLRASGFQVPSICQTGLGLCWLEDMVGATSKPTVRANPGAAEEIPKATFTVVDLIPESHPQRYLCTYNTHRDVRQYFFCLVLSWFKVRGSAGRWRSSSEHLLLLQRTKLGSQHPHWTAHSCL